MYLVAVMASSCLLLVVLAILSLTKDLADVSGNVLSSLTSGADLSPPQLRSPWLHRDFRLCAAVLHDVRASAAMFDIQVSNSVCQMSSESI